MAMSKLCPFDGRSLFLPQSSFLWESDQLLLDSPKQLVKRTFDDIILIIMNKLLNTQVAGDLKYHAPLMTSL